MKITVRGLSELRARLDTMRERVGNLRPALLSSAKLVLDKAKVDIRSGGDPPWAPTKFPSNLHPPLVRTGDLFDSLSDGDSVTDIPQGVRVGTNIFYAPYLQHGTKKQNGTKKMVARPFLPDPSEEPMASRIKQTIADFIARGE